MQNNRSLNFCLQKRKRGFGIGNVRIKTEAEFKEHRIYYSATGISRESSLTFLK